MATYYTWFVILRILHIFWKPSLVCILIIDVYKERNINTAREVEELQLLVTLRASPDRTYSVTNASSRHGYYVYEFSRI